MTTRSRSVTQNFTPFMASRLETIRLYREASRCERAERKVRGRKRVKVEGSTKLERTVQSAGLDAKTVAALLTVEKKIKGKR